MSTTSNRYIAPIRDARFDEFYVSAGTHCCRMATFPRRLQFAAYAWRLRYAMLHDWWDTGDLVPMIISPMPEPGDFIAAFG